MKSFAAIIVCIFVSVATSTLFGQDEPVAAEIPPALEVYKGRRIARTMHYLGAPWLIRENRENQERCSLMLANLGVKPGMTVGLAGAPKDFEQTLGPLPEDVRLRRQTRRRADLVLWFVTRTRELEDRIRRIENCLVVIKERIRRHWESWHMSELDRLLKKAKESGRYVG